MLPCQSASMSCLCMVLSSLSVCPAYPCYYPVCQYAFTIHATTPVFRYTLAMNALMPVFPKYAYYYLVCQYALNMHRTIPSASMPCPCVLLSSLSVCPDCTCYHASLPVFPFYACYYIGCQYALPMNAFIQSVSTPWLYMLLYQFDFMPLLCMLLYRLPVCPIDACYYPVYQYALTIYATIQIWL